MQQQARPCPVRGRPHRARPHPATRRADMTTMTPEPGSVTGGVDTHLDVHVAAATDPLGGVLGTEAFRASASGYRRLLRWLRSFGPIHAVGVEGTGSYGSALARHL